ncbi:MAG: M12 family metallopeptidase [Pseudonocardiaceae bacterium]
MTTSNEETRVSGAKTPARTTTHTGYLSGPGFVDVAVRYVVEDGRAIFDGCIDMGPVEQVEAHAAQVQARLAAAAAAQSESGVPPVQISGIGLPPDSDFLWTNGVVPFIVDPALLKPERVTQAIAHIHENTAIRFVARTNQTNYVRFVRHPDKNWSQSSAIGMKGGEQFIRLHDGASVGTTVHECCHALGMKHEQSRCDRDKFVQINYANIDDEKVGNFDKFCAGYDDYFDYDYGSIMHYGTKNFSKNGKPTIEVLQPGVTIGQRDGLSFGDRRTIAHMYARFTGRGHTGVWRAGSGKYGLWVNVPWDSFTAKWKEWADQGLRLVDINVHQQGDENRYTGVWLPGTGGYGLWANATWDSFTAKWKEWAGQGLRLVDINVHQQGDENRYTGVWLPGTDGYYLWANVPWESLRATWQELGAKGLRLVDYEFTEPSTAADQDLDFAGLPVSAPVMQSLPVGIGGIIDPTDPFDLELPAAISTDGLPAAQPVPTTTAADGQGDYQVGGTIIGTSAMVADGDGHGDAYPGEPLTSPSTAENGMGDAVINGSRPVAPLAFTELPEGMGEAIS